MFDYFHATPAQWREVLPRLIVPERRSEEAARAALRGTRGVREGWELLLRTMDLRSPDPWLPSWWEHTYEAQLRGRRSYPVRADTEAERLVHNWLYNLWSRLPAKAAASVGRSIAESISLALRWRVLQREQAFLSREALLASRPRGEELERWDESAVETLATTPLEELRDVGEVQVALLHMGYSLGRFSEEGLELRTPRLALRHH